MTPYEVVPKQLKIYDKQRKIGLKLYQYYEIHISIKCWNIPFTGISVLSRVMLCYAQTNYWGYHTCMTQVTVVGPYSCKICALLMRAAFPEVALYPLLLMRILLEFTTHQAWIVLQALSFVFLLCWRSLPCSTSIGDICRLLRGTSGQTVSEVNGNGGLSFMTQSGL